MVRSSQQVPAPQLLSLKPLRDLVLDDAGHPCLDVLQNVAQLKLPLKRGRRNLFSAQQSGRHGIWRQLGGGGTGKCLRCIIWSAIHLWTKNEIIFPADHIMSGRKSLKVYILGL